MSIEKRIEALECAVNDIKSAINAQNAESSAFHAALNDAAAGLARDIKASTIPETRQAEYNLELGVVRDEEKTAQNQAVVQLEDDGCKVHLPAGGVVAINRF